MEKLIIPTIRENVVSKYFLDDNLIMIFIIKEPFINSLPPYKGDNVFFNTFLKHIQKYKKHVCNLYI